MRRRPRADASKGGNNQTRTHQSARTDFAQLDLRKLTAFAHINCSYTPS